MMPIDSHQQTLRPVKSLPVLLFVLAIVSLDISFGATDLRVGNIIVLLGSATAIVLARTTEHWFDRPRLTIFDGIYLSYLALIAASASWAPSATDTLVQLILLFTIWLATIFLSREPLITLPRYVIHIAFICALLSFALLVVAPHMAYQPSLRGATDELRGIFHHQLRFGVYLGLAIGFMIIAKLNGDLPLIFDRPYTFYIYLPVLFVALFMANARLYTLATVLSLLFVLILPRAGWARLILIAIVIGLIVMLIQDQSTVMADLDENGVDITLTGRTTIWEKTSALAAKVPWLGYGYPSFDHPSFDWLWGEYRPAHPHNSFLQAYFETGYIGFLLVVAMAAWQFVVALRNTGIERRYSYTLFIVCVTILGSLTGANYAAKPSALFVYMLLAFAIDSRRAPMVRAFEQGRIDVGRRPFEASHA